MENQVTLSSYSTQYYLYTTALALAYDIVVCANKSCVPGTDILKIFENVSNNTESITDYAVAARDIFLSTLFISASGAPELVDTIVHDTFFIVNDCIDSVYKPVLQTPEDTLSNAHESIIAFGNLVGIDISSTIDAFSQTTNLDTFRKSHSVKISHELDYEECNKALNAACNSIAIAASCIVSKVSS